MKILNLNIIERLNRIKAKPLYANKEREKLIEGNRYKSYNPKIFIKDIILGILLAAFNIILFIINIYFLFYKKNIHINKFNDLKEIDQYIFLFIN